MSVVAKFWKPVSGGRTQCVLCPHLCVIDEGKEGLCKARGTRQGKLHSLVADRPATVVSDEIEKKPFYHFHPGTRVLSLGTLGCNVLCSDCQNWQISHASGREADRLSPLPSARVLELARRHKLQGVVWGYNDPAIWVEYIHDVAVAAKKAGLYTGFVTAGYLMPDALDYVAPYLDAFKYDLKAPDAKGWSWLNKVKDPAPTWDITVRAKEVHGCHIEVVSNIVPGLNDDDESLRTMATWVREALGPKTPWHVTRFLPDFQLSYLPPTPIKTLERGVEIGRKVGLQFVYTGNVPGHQARHTVCPSCHRTVIHRGERGAEQVWVREGRCAFCGEELQVVL